MGEGGPELVTYLGWDPSGAMEPPRIASTELVAGLTSTWAMVEVALTRWTLSDLSRNFSPPSTLSDEEREIFGDAPRDWIIWHVFEHEIHHGGEISLVLGMNGLPGIYGEM